MKKAICLLLLCLPALAAYPQGYPADPYDIKDDDGSKIYNKLLRMDSVMQAAGMDSQRKISAYYSGVPNLGRTKS